jgi:hypothetical protein
MARRFRGPLVTVNVQTGDGRVIADDAISVAPLPLPFAWLRDGDQHVGLTEVAPQVGIIESIERVGDDWVGEGLIDDEQPDGAELCRRMDAGLASHGARQLVSIDPDDWAVEIIATESEGDDDGVLILASAGTGTPPRYARTAAAGDPDPGDGGVLLFEDASDSILERYTRLRIRGATACAVSAFTEAWVELVADAAEPADDEPADPEEEPADPPADDEAEGSTTAAAIAPAAVVRRPPADVFAIPEPDLDTQGMVEVYGMPAQELLTEQPDGGLAVPFTIATRPDGTRAVFGHAARWEQCHIGYPGSCITAPESAAAYAHFHVGEVHCADGSRVATGTLTMGCDHAAAELRAPEARDHYAHSGLAFADVRASNGALGVWVAGVLRPDVTEQQLHVIRASSLSGDWRRIGAGLEFIGALAVNVPGFPIAREAVTAAGLQQLPLAALSASAYLDDGVQTSLVASGIVQRCPDCQRRAMANRGQQPASSADPEVLDLLRKVELRTRHLAPAAAEHALTVLRRGATISTPKLATAERVVRPPRR